MKKEFGKKVLMWSIVSIGMLSILVLAGEPVDDTVTASEILIPKLIAAAALLSSAFFGRYAQRRGWFPEGEKPFNEN